VITSDPGDAYLQGGRALARWVVGELEICLPHRRPPLRAPQCPCEAPQFQP